MYTYITCIRITVNVIYKHIRWLSTSCLHIIHIHIYIYTYYVYIRCEHQFRSSSPFLVTETSSKGSSHTQSVIHWKMRSFCFKMFQRTWFFFANLYICICTGPWMFDPYPRLHGIGMYRSGRHGRPQTVSACFSPGFAVQKEHFRYPPTKIAGKWW